MNEHETMIHHLREGIAHLARHSEAVSASVESYLANPDPFSSGDDHQEGTDNAN